jgi:hypothetical protein
MIAVAKFQQIFIDIQLSFKADSQLSTSWKAFLRLLHHPAMLAQLFAALNASSLNVTSNVPLSHVRTTAPVVIALVGVQLCHSFKGMPE